MSPAVKTLGALTIKSQAEGDTITGEGSGASTLKRSPFQITQ